MNTGLPGLSLHIARRRGHDGSDVHELTHGSRREHGQCSRAANASDSQRLAADSVSPIHLPSGDAPLVVHGNDVPETDHGKPHNRSDQDADSLDTDGPEDKHQVPKRDALSECPTSVAAVSSTPCCFPDDTNDNAASWGRRTLDTDVLDGNYFSTGKHASPESSINCLRVSKLIAALPLEPHDCDHEFLARQILAEVFTPFMTHA